MSNLEGIFSGSIISWFMATNLTPVNTLGDVTAIGAIVIIATTVGMGVIKILDKLVNYIMESKRIDKKTFCNDCPKIEEIKKEIKEIKGKLEDVYGK